MKILKQELEDLNKQISRLESDIKTTEREAEANIKPLKEELDQLKEDKRNFASKNDFDSVQDCRRREDNLKFKINAQWNMYSILNNDLSQLKKKRLDLEAKIRLEEDKIKRNNEIRSKMDIVLDNYEKSQNLKQAAIDSNINPNTVEQWHEWGKNSYDEICSYFYHRIAEIDNHFRDLKSQELKRQMDSVAEAYKKTHSLKDAARIANVNPDTVEYWYEWGSRGFGEENTYFFKKLKEVKS